MSETTLEWILVVMVAGMLLSGGLVAGYLWGLMDGREAAYREIDQSHVERLARRRHPSTGAPDA